MKFRLASDLHFDHYSDWQNQATIGKLFLDGEDYDTILLAGDLANAPGLDHALELLLKGVSKPILYVPGNHDYSQKPDQSVHETNEILERLHQEGGHFWNLREHDYPFRNKAGELRKVVGVTNWYPATPLILNLGRRGWYDFRYIPDFEAELHHMNRVDTFNLRSCVAEGDIALSHMLPSWKCVHNAYAGDRCNVFFVGDREQLILERKPAFWGFGHTHRRMHLTIGETQLACHPRGYPQEGVETNWADISYEV